MLEKLIKLVEKWTELLIILHSPERAELLTRAGGAREADKTRREVDGVADNFTEGDVFPESGEAREVRAGEIFRQSTKAGPEKIREV